MTNNNNAEIAIIDTLTVQDNRIVASSADIAGYFNKRHDNVVQAIEKINCSQEFNNLNFKESLRTQETGQGARRKFKTYQITKDGFIFLVMGFTGKKAAAMKEAYINAFNQMQTQQQQKLTDKENKNIVDLRQTINTKNNEIFELKNNKNKKRIDTTDMMAEHLIKIVRDVNDNLSGIQNTLLMAVSRNTGFSQTTRISNIKSVQANLKMINRELSFVVLADMNKESEALQSLAFSG